MLTGNGQDDEYWNWVGKSRRSKLLPGDELYAIECEGVTQGLLMLDVLKKRCLIESQLRRRLVYISALATAPWNRPMITNPLALFTLRHYGQMTYDSIALCSVPNPVG
jgi:hypothetical protein